MIVLFFAGLYVLIGCVSFFITVTMEKVHGVHRPDDMGITALFTGVMWPLWVGFNILEGIFNTGTDKVADLIRKRKGL